MRKTSLIFLLGLVLILSAFSAAHAGAKLEIPSRSFNFGKVIQHVTVTHDFWLKSVGDEPLKVTNIWPGCGCTQIPLEDSTIAPGDSVALKIILDTQSFRGNLTKHPKIATTADSGSITLRLDAEMIIKPDEVKPLSLSPAKLDVSQFGKKVRRRAKFDIVNHSDEDFKVSAIDIRDKGFKVKLPEVVKAGETAKVTIVVDEDAVETDFAESITFEAESTQDRVRYTIPITRVYKPGK